MGKAKNDTTISINGGPEVPIDLAMAAVNHIKGRRKDEAVPFGVDKIEQGALARLMFHDGNRDKMLEYADNSLRNMLYSKFQQAFDQLEKGVHEGGGSGEIALSFKMLMSFRGGAFYLEDMAAEWTRKVGSKDKDFDTVKFDPNQPDLPGMEGGDK